MDREKNDIPNDIKLYNAVEICDNNIAIERIIEKCIDCGICKNACQERTGILDLCEGKACLYCGACLQLCPVGAIKIKSDIFRFLKARKNQTCIAYIAPAVRVSIGEAFGMPKGSFVQGKVITALKKIGFKYVFDVTSAADITVIEEAAELVRRIKNNGVLPMFTSCCPSWVKYVENFYPEFIPNLSTCKSPISMQSAIVRSYFCKKMELDEDNIFTVAVTPCTSKKYEITRPELDGTDSVLTAQEIVEVIKQENIDFASLEDSDFDNCFAEGTGAGMLFGNTGGVMEATIRTVYKILANKNLTDEQLVFNPIRGLKGVKCLNLDINGININIAVVNKLSNVVPLLEKIKEQKENYHFIEVMSCVGGCIGGAGLPKIKDGLENQVMQKRMEGLQQRDANALIRESYRNVDAVKIYNELLEHPLSQNSDYLLHTYYRDQKQN